MDEASDSVEVGITSKKVAPFNGKVSSLRLALGLPNTPEGGSGASVAATVELAMPIAKKVIRAAE